MTKGKPPRWSYRPLYYWGFVLRWIFGYGTMDEVSGALWSGMFLAEERERFEQDFGKKMPSLRRADR